MQVIARAHHRDANREHKLKQFRFDEATEATIQASLDAYASATWFDLYAQMRAFASDVVLTAFRATLKADEEVRRAAGAQAAITAANATTAGLAQVGIPVNHDVRASAKAASEAAAAVRHALSAGTEADDALVAAIRSELHAFDPRRK